LDLKGKLTVGHGVTITAWVKILTHDDARRILGEKEKKFVTIKSGAFIGLNSIILDGITIGENSIIGAGSVVTKDVLDGEIWAGNPAKKLRSIGVTA
jgi:acetyltransferase-like isoleucine patch superfamily enzyme